MTILFTHEVCVLHDMGKGHPEQPARLLSVLEGLSSPEFADLLSLEAPEATKEQIALMHPMSFIDFILENVPKEGLAQVDSDTALSPYTGEAALRAAGAVIAAVDALCGGEIEGHKNVFCATRPPGHHAEPEQAMGFCFFSNVAIGAAYAREAYGLKRCAVIDFDVHHGNGTEACFLDEEDFLYISTHQSPLYPGTGAASMTGPYNNIVNCPLPAFADGEDLRAVFEEKVLPALEDFKPELLFISAGFDAHRDDPLAEMSLTEEDYAWATRALMKIADAYCQGRVISSLEGGYDLEALKLSVMAHVKELMAA